MTGKNFPLGIVAGLLLGVVLVNGLSGVLATPRVMAQAQPQQQPAAQRYQIAAWAYPAGSINVNNGVTASHGAYILDTQSGRVWQIVQGGKPMSLGGVE